MIGWHPMVECTCSITMWTSTIKPELYSDMFMASHIFDSIEDWNPRPANFIASLSLSAVMQAMRTEQSSNQVLKAFMTSYTYFCLFFLVSATGFKIGNSKISKSIRALSCWVDFTANFFNLFNCPSKAMVWFSSVSVTKFLSGSTNFSAVALNPRSTPDCALAKPSNLDAKAPQ
jgi:hypothetical protein